MNDYIYLGIDDHKWFATIAAVNEAGETLKVEPRVQKTSEDIKRFLISLGANNHYKAVLEAGRNWGVTYDLLESLPQVAEVILANPFKVKAIASAYLKTDTVDALTLAHLRRVNYIPQVHIPDKKTRQLKYLIRQRAFLVVIKTQLKNRIHIILERNHISTPEVTDLFGKKGREFMATVELPPTERFLLSQHLELLKYCEVKIKEVGDIARAELATDERVRLLKTVPGIGEVFAPLIALEIEDINRFSEPKKLWSYSGLVPTTYASGKRVYHGRLIKYCNKWLRWAFIEGVHSAIRCSIYFGRYYEFKEWQKGSQAATISTARRLARVVYWVLKDNQEYKEPRYSSTFFNLRGSGQA
ncbi:MAG: IS110 family transposase [candidate division WOR-3 bacterium]